MRPSRRSWLTTAALLGGVFALGGCLAPTLPVPPPANPDISAPDADGMVTVKGGKGSARPNWTVHVEKQGNPPGVDGFEDAALADGSWEIKLPAKSGDRLAIWQEQGTERSTVLSDQVVP